MSRVLDQIGQLVASPSVSSAEPKNDMGNRGVIDLLAGWLDDEGFAVEVMEVESPEGLSRANLIATRGRGAGGLVLSGHTDTVPAGEHGWSSDPFRASVRDDKMYGLGTTDMKAFLALAIEAARRTRDLPQLRPLTILATADEECAMAGARALVAAARPKAACAVIGEPTSLHPVRMHKGFSAESVVIVGRSGHSSDPSHGRSALEGMRRAMNAIVEVRESLAGRYIREDLRPKVPTINLGDIRGGDAPNRICARCELEFDVRLLPGMDVAAVRSELHQAIEQAISGLGLAFEIRPSSEAIPPFETASRSAIVRAAEELSGYSAEAAAFCTEAPYLSSLGMDTIVLGPGDIEVAHQPDEHLRLDRVEPCIDLLSKLIERFCAVEDAA